MMMNLPPISREYEGEPVASELPLLIEAVYGEIVSVPTDLNALKSALGVLLSFLASPGGRTNANCWATDGFFCLQEGWEAGWDHLPAGYQELLADLGGALHDTVQSPQVARNFQSTPEQLLERLSKLAPSEGAV